MIARLGCVVALLLTGHALVIAQEVDQSRGVDPDVNYESLKSFGPWDDRNYLLMRADLELLAENEEQLVVPIPAFFRVRLRKDSPDLPRDGPAQYPRSALQIFLSTCGGFLIDGKLYQHVRLENGQYVVVQQDGVDAPAPQPPTQATPR